MRKRKRKEMRKKMRGYRTEFMHFDIIVNLFTFKCTKNNSPFTLCNFLKPEKFRAVTQKEIS